MSDIAHPTERAAEYLRQADRMRLASERAFDPQISAQYLALSAAWLRLAEEAQKGVRYIDRSAASQGQRT